MPGTRSYIVAGAVTKSPDLLPLEQTDFASDPGPFGGRVALGRTASETGHPEDREQETHDARADPYPRDEGQEDDPHDDECDRSADHGSGVPAAAERETSGLQDHEPLLGHLADRVGGAFLRVAGSLDSAIGHLVGAE